MEVITQDRVIFGTDPVVLIGEPSHCAGLASMRSPEKVPVKLKRLRLRVAAPLSRATGGEIEIRLSTVLYPGEMQHVSVALALPLGTPPGSYEAFLDGGDKVCRPVSILVLEHHQTQLSPAAFTCTSSPGATFCAHLGVSNLGNVPVVIPSRAPMELHADRSWPYHFHQAVKSHGGDGNQAFLDSFLKRLGADEPPVGRTKVLAGEGSLAPQETRLIEIEVAIPKRLRAGRSYRAVVRLADASLRMRLLVTAVDDLASAQGDS